MNPLACSQEEAERLLRRHHADTNQLGVLYWSDARVHLSWLQVIDRPVDLITMRRARPFVSVHHVPVSVHGNMTYAGIHGCLTSVFFERLAHLPLLPHNVNGMLFVRGR